VCPSKTASAKPDFGRRHTGLTVSVTQAHVNVHIPHDCVLVANLRISCVYSRKTLHLKYGCQLT